MTDFNNNNMEKQNHLESSSSSYEEEMETYCLYDSKNILRGVFLDHSSATKEAIKYKELAGLEIKIFKKTTILSAEKEVSFLPELRVRVYVLPIMIKNNNAFFLLSNDSRQQYSENLEPLGGTLEKTVSDKYPYTCKIENDVAGVLRELGEESGYQLKINTMDILESKRFEHDFYSNDRHTNLPIQSKYIYYYVFVKEKDVNLNEINANLEEISRHEELPVELREKKALFWVNFLDVGISLSKSLEFKKEMSEKFPDDPPFISKNTPPDLKILIEKQKEAIRISAYGSDLVQVDSTHSSKKFRFTSYLLHTQANYILEHINSLKSFFGFYNMIADFVTNISTSPHKVDKI